MIRDFQGTLADALQSNLVLPGDILHLRGGTYAGDYWMVLDEATPDAMRTIQPYLAEKPIIDGSITVQAEYTIVKNLHIKDADFLTRITEIAGGAPADIPANDAAQISQSNIILQDCILENTRQGIYRVSTTTNLTLDGCIVYHNGWTGPDRPHGHGCYLTGTLGAVRNSILFSNFEFGIKIYDEEKTKPAINDFTIEDNIVFNNSVIGGQVRTRGDIMYGHGTMAFYRAVVRRNYTYQLAQYMVPDENNDANTNHLGYVKPAYDATLVDNYFPNGLMARAENTYLENSGNVFAPEEVNRVFVIPVRGRAHVAIYNWQLLDTVTVDVSAVFDPGASVTVTNVQDYFVDRQPMTVSAGGTLDIDMRAISHTVATPQGLDAPATTFPQFGCFVIRVA